MFKNNLFFFCSFFKLAPELSVSVVLFAFYFLYNSLRHFLHLRLVENLDCLFHRRVAALSFVRVFIGVVDAQPGLKSRRA